MHTYLLYPASLLRAAERRCKASVPAAVHEPADWPPVHLLMAVHNEETVLPDKLRSIRRLAYPGPLTVHIASDRSTDATDRQLREFTASYPAQLTFNPARRGKPGSINALASALPRAGIFFFTDASVMLHPDTLTELVRAIVADPGVGVADAVMQHTGVPGAGVGKLEDAYIRREVALKRAESCLWKSMIGPFGGCWAMRAEAFRAVPENFLVDDFFLCMSAYEAGWRGVTAPAARAREGVGVRLRDEFRRKRRIGAGNWQNLVRFRGLWWPPGKSALHYAFFSHKVLRWLSPYLLLAGGLATLGLIAYLGNYWSALAFLVMTVALCAVVPALRYFSAMNAALLLGGVDYLTGIKTNVWQPSHRNEQRD